MDQRYDFHIVRSRAMQITVLSALPLAFVILLGYALAPGYQHSFLGSQTGNLLLLFLVFGGIVFLLFHNRRFLFWKEVAAEVNTQTQEITIAGKRFSLSALDYFEFSPGTAISGTDRFVLGIKFEKARKFVLLPCKNSELVENYDAFVDDFLMAVDACFVAEDKERLENKTLQKFYGAVLLSGTAWFIYLLFMYGTAAGKMIPGLLVAYGLFLPQMFKAKTSNRARREMTRQTSGF